jgi:hypothetical protein
MKTNTKILIGFFSIIILILIQTLITYKLQNNILDNTRQIKDIEHPLTVLASSSQSYDLETTRLIYSALLYAQKGNFDDIKNVKIEYDNVRSVVNSIIESKSVEILLTQSRRSQVLKDESIGYLNDMVAFGIKALDIETKAWKSIEQKDTDTAYSLLIAGDYQKDKAEIYQDSQNLIDIEKETWNILNDEILKKSQQIIYFNLGISILNMIIIIVILLTIRSWVAGKSLDKKR